VTVRSSRGPRSRGDAALDPGMPVPAPTGTLSIMGLRAVFLSLSVLCACGATNEDASLGDRVDQLRAGQQQRQMQLSTLDQQIQAAQREVMRQQCLEHRTVRFAPKSRGQETAVNDLKVDDGGVTPEVENVFSDAEVACAASLFPREVCERVLDLYALA
jgi:outer membrane murein-binding lipoprotein Lpp